MIEGNPLDKKVPFYVSDLLRGLVTDVADGNEEALYICFILLKNFRLREKMLLWLRNNNLKGKKLVDWVKLENKGSPLQTFSYIIKKLEKNIHRRPIILGEDFIS